MEIVLSKKSDYNQISKYFVKNNINSIFVVCYHFKEKPSIINYLESLNINITYFSDYTPNPTYDEVCNGIELFRKSNSNFILAIGGGSAIDVAKCIKAFSTMDDKQSYLKQEIKENNILLGCVPTTAGTGSEATRYAVIYFGGEKQSITSNTIIPSLVLFDANFLKSLPLNVKKATWFDAFSHSIESIWSVNSTEESKEYAKQAIQLLLKNLDDYLNSDESTYFDMLKAANLAGKAINITQTTAGHAMCYKLTSLYGIPHGQSAGLINSVLFPYMIDNINDCCDVRGKEYLKKTFNEISKSLGCKSLRDAKTYISKLLIKLNLYDVSVNFDDIETVSKSVNVDRLKNNPVKLDYDNIKSIYVELFEEIERRKAK